MAHSEVRGKGHFEVREKSPPCAIHGWSAVEDCPRPEAGSAPNVRQYNSGACIWWSQIYMKRAKIQCMFKAPFLWATINSPIEVDLWRQRRKMHVAQVFHTRTEPHTFARFNHAQNVQICIVCRDNPSFKRSIICIWTVLTIRAETLAIKNGAKKPGDGLRYVHVVHAFQFSAISEGSFLRVH